MKKLVIFGVGLIGGSLALALRRVQPDLYIVGVGRSGENLQEALQLDVINHYETDPTLAVSDADLIFIATPVAQIPNILRQIKAHLAPHTLITDAGSTKTDVVTCAQEILGEQFKQFVPGHPIAGAEKSGVSAAMATLYDKKNVVLTPCAETPTEALNAVRDLWIAAGALVSVMSHQEHDAVFAAVSHLPHLLAYALVDSIASRPNASQLFSYAAGGFRDFSRIAASSPEMWRDISFANRDALLSELKTYQAEISLMQTLLENNDQAGLFALFERASTARRNWGNQQISAEPTTAAQTK